MTSSSDGNKLAIVDVGNGYIHTSSDSGLNWSTQYSTGRKAWRFITSSLDGNSLIAGVNSGYIYTSTNSGATWTQQTNSGQHYWYSIASSSDGVKLAAVANNDYIYTSTNSGATWTQQTNLGSRDWYSIASSYDGTKLAAVDDFNGYVYTFDIYNTLTYNHNAHGTIQGTTPQTVNDGSDGSEVTAIPDTGYHFTSWSDASTDNPRTDHNVTNDITVTASFAINTYTLTYTPGTGGTITGTTSQTIDY